MKGAELSSKNTARFFPDEVDSTVIFCEGTVRQVLIAIE
jgi:hypothetical protein